MRLHGNTNQSPQLTASEIFKTHLHLTSHTSIHTYTCTYENLHLYVRTPKPIDTWTYQHLFTHHPPVHLDTSVYNLREKRVPSMKKPTPAKQLE